MYNRLEPELLILYRSGAEPATREFKEGFMWGLFHEVRSRGISFNLKDTVSTI
jgi:hypothetical protein